MVALTDQHSAFSAIERTWLTGFALTLVDSLLIDDIWTEAVSSGKDDAPIVGNRLVDAIGRIREGLGGVGELIERAQRDQLEAIWPPLVLEMRMPSRNKKALVHYAAGLGGIGNAGLSAIKDLERLLPSEVELLSTKIATLESGLDSVGDLRVPTRLAIAVLCLSCIVAIALPLAAGAAGAAGAALGAYNALANLAMLAGGIAGATLFLPPQP